MVKQAIKHKQSNFKMCVLNSFYSVWSSEQKHQHRLGAWEKWRLSTTPTQTDQATVFAVTLCSKPWEITAGRKNVEP